MANLCERTAADITEVRRGVCSDARIGFAFMFPGVGYGGSCFPKDVRALASLARKVGVEPRILEAVDTVNTRQKSVMFAKVSQNLGALAGLKLAIWGLAFKPRTDDIREAPALVLIDQLLAQGATLHVHDPEAMDNVRALYGDRLVYAARPYDALDGARALVVMTEWKDYQGVDFAEVKRRMASPVIFDGRNIYDPEACRKAGITYHSIGRASV
jgi:UDPglucose 6-dehydrogenase